LKDWKNEGIGILVFREVEDQGIRTFGGMREQGYWFYRKVEEQRIGNFEGLEE